MAKKKTAEKAKIEAAPVLRAQGDDSTPETPVITKSYSVRDDWKDKSIVNYVAFKSVDGEVQDLMVNGEPAGGGGGGNISYATVNITNESQNAISVYIPCTDDTSPGSYFYVYGKLDPGAHPDMIVPIGPDDVTIGDVILTNSNSITCSGGVESELISGTTYSVSVSGNGTIHIS